MHGFLIAGTNSGCGKTTVTIGLMALLKSHGHKIAPFKTGPDYIDPLFHSEVLETPSYNLDSYMLSEQTIGHLFIKHCKDKDIAIVEGVMGMYDGMGKNATGSSYEVSQLLNLPVILVVSCKGLYQSVSAIVRGFSKLKSDANVKGVILNNVASDEYYQFLKTIVERDCNISCLGYVPTDKYFALESRHLGLIQAEEVNDLSKKVEKLTQTLAKTIDTKKLLEISKLKTIESTNFTIPNIDLSSLHIGVAHDKAFRFYYKDNLELLEELGARLHYFSPLKSTQIPQKCNCLYLGGGYPEVFIEELSANKGLLKNIKQVVVAGMPVYAECGGLMYLADKIIALDGTSHQMTGVFNAAVQMTKRLQRFGYAQVNYNGTQANCHEFHRSEIVNETSEPNYTLEFELNKPEKQKEWQCGLMQNNCLAGYAHVHFYSNFQFFKQIVKLWKQAII
ncbi:MAG: cobyrinate a,c-diamide synthase [Salinivirgaceae bacterium]|jgi:cobyrinic acid a,c-diamide synthase|nr:cobyrinate a,c-diamide synthase [Salinivirgaceae bacterium]